MPNWLLVLAVFASGAHAQAPETQIQIEYERISPSRADSDYAMRQLWRDGRHRLRIQYPKDSNGSSTLTIANGRDVITVGFHPDYTKQTRSNDPDGEPHAYLLDRGGPETLMPLEIGNEVEFFKDQKASREANEQFQNGTYAVYAINIEPYHLKLYIDLNNGMPRQLTVKNSLEEYSISYLKYARGALLFDKKWMGTAPQFPSNAEGTAHNGGRGGNRNRVKIRKMTSLESFPYNSATASNGSPDSLASAHERAGNFNKAIRAFRADSSGEDYPPNIFHITWLEFLRGDYKKGGEMIAAHAGIFAKETTHDGGEAYRAAALAEMYRFDGDNTRALYYYYHAKAGPFAEATFQIASIYLNQGHLMGAQRHFQQIRLHRNESQSAESLYLTGTGLLAIKLGYYEVGRSYFERALQQSEEDGANYPKALALEQLGRTSLLMLDYKTAERRLQDAISFQESIGMSGRSAQLAIGDLYMKTGRPAKAFDIYQREHAGISLASWYFSAGRVEDTRRQIGLMLPKTEAVHYSDARFALYTISGLIEEKEGKSEKAVAWFKKACAVGESLRNTTGFPLHIERYGIAGTEPYEGLVRTAPACSGGLPESFAYSELTKARMFSRAAGNIGYDEFDGLPIIKPRWVNKTLKIYPLQDEEEKLENPLGRNGAKTDAEFLEDARELDAAFAKYNAAISSISVIYPVFGDRAYPKQLSLPDLHLHPRERLIEFEVTALDTRVFVVSSGTLLHAYTINQTRDQLREEIDKYRLYFNAIKDGQDLARYDPRLSARLYDTLLRPAFEAKSSAGVPMIPKNSEVIIVPDEFLGAVSFESLVTALPRAIVMPSTRNGPMPTGLRYLADDYDIAYQHSATSLLALRRASWKPTYRKLFALADPIFDESDPRSRPLLSKSSTTLAVKTMGLGGKREGELPDKGIGAVKAVFPRLDRTALLAETLMKKVFSGADVMILQGDAASERKLQQVDLSKFTYLLFATHGVLDGTLPGVKEPALVLNQVGNDESYDGYLTETKVMRLKLNADIVALTACQTGLGKSVSGEGMMGLGRAFQLAGAKNVLISLWNVSENSTSILAEQFFRHVKDGASPRQALRFARQDVRRQGYEHPFYWAPFVLYGN